MYGLNAIIICNPWTLDIIKIHFVCYVEMQMQLYINAISYSKSFIDTTGSNRGRIFNHYASTKILFF